MVVRPSLSWFSSPQCGGSGAIGRFRRAAGAVLIAGSLFVSSGSAIAQSNEADPTGSLLDPGQLVTTGFSGIVLSDAIDVDPNSATRIDETFINTDGATIRILDVGGVPLGGGETDKRAAEAFSLTAREIGQVFGIALDDAINPRTGLPAPNIYLGASSAYGLHVVVPDREGDGWPKRIVTGDPEATWMDGLWGSELGGDPGTIWKVDGVTGKVSLFARIEINDLPNSGPGLGNLAYDKDEKLIFASDMDTGLIVSLDLEGNVVGTYDHGVEGRTAVGLDVVEDDADARADITSEAYEADNPSTWGYTLPPRRVWGLKTHAGRLYYAVAEGPEIWSVGFGEGGTFGGARREIKLPADAEPYEIADISFTADGRMVLAQRPPVTGGYDYVTPVASGPARLLRYRAADPKDGTGTAEYWFEEPEEYAVGLKGESRNTSGGIALGYGYKPTGGLDYGRCETTIWTTGESLFEQQTRAFKVDAVPGLQTTAAIDGLQGTPIDLVRPDNLPPENARFVDYDGRYIDYGYRGHLGDVEIPYLCGGAGQKIWEPEYPSPWWETTYVEGTPERKRELDLSVKKFAVGKCRAGGLCRFEIRVTNRGNQVYYGPIVLADTMTGGTLALVKSGPAPWSCGQSGSFVSCNRPSVFLKPGRSLSLWLTVRLSSGWATPKLGNCARIDWPANADEDSLARSVAIELSARGFYAGVAEAELTPDLIAAIRDYQSAVGLVETGAIDRELIISLFGRGAWRDGDSNPRNDKGCAEHFVAPKLQSAPVFLMAATEVIKPKLDFKPKPIVCKPGHVAKKGICVPICAPGKILKNGKCVYVPEEIVCKGGKTLSNGKCVCPSGTKSVFNGTKTVCEKIKPISCDGGKVKNGKCVCPGGSSLVKLDAKNSYCEPVREDLRCDGGKVKSGICLCKAGLAPAKIAPRHYVCRRIKVDPDVICKGGAVKAGVCYCPKGTDRRDGGRNVFYCEPSDDDPPQRAPKCIDGTLDQNLDCRCRKGWQLKQIGKNAYQCVKPGNDDPADDTCPPGTIGKKVGGNRVCIPEVIIDIGPKIKCTNGKVVDGKCVCGKNYTLQKRGKRSYVCVKANDESGGKVDPTPVCGQGEELRRGKCVPKKKGGKIEIEINDNLELKLDLKKKKKPVVVEEDQPNPKKNIQEQLQNELLKAIQKQKKRKEPKQEPAEEQQKQEIRCGNGEQLVNGNCVAKPKLNLKLLKQVVPQ